MGRLSELLARAVAVCELDGSPNPVDGVASLGVEELERPGRVVSDSSSRCLSEDVRGSLADRKCGSLVVAQLLVATLERMAIAQVGAGKRLGRAAEPDVIPIP